MTSSFFRIPNLLFSRHVTKLLTGKPFSVEKPPQDSVERRVKQIKLIGAAGITTILFASYVLIKRHNQTDQNIETAYTSKSYNIEDILGSSKIVQIAEEKKREQSIREKYNFINKVVSQCAPAVFYLEIRDPYKKDIETGDSIITSNGSGFLISEDGWALTNAHVVLNKPQSTITAVMRDGRSYKVHVEDADMNIDLALLKIDSPHKLPSLKFGIPGDTGVGEWVVALGSPLSLSNSVTVGIVSCVARPASELGLKNYSMTYIQTDASVTFGNSGGPLVNLDGDVIGINNLRLTSGISFAIPVEYAQKFLENSKFRIKRSRTMGVMGKTLFGMTTISITPELLTDLAKENRDFPMDVEQGLLVWKVIEGTPASDSGIAVGDIITHVNGVPVKEASEMYFLAASYEIIEIGLVQKGQKKIIMLDTRYLN